MNEHTITVTFDDDVTNIEAIVTALAEAGYTAPRKDKLN